MGKRSDTEEESELFGALRFGDDFLDLLGEEHVDAVVFSLLKSYELHK